MLPPGHHTMIGTTFGGTTDWSYSVDFSSNGVPVVDSNGNLSYKGKDPVTHGDASGTKDEYNLRQHLNSQKMQSRWKRKDDPASTDDMHSSHSKTHCVECYVVSFWVDFADVNASAQIADAALGGATEGVGSIPGPTGVVGGIVGGSVSGGLSHFIEEAATEPYSIYHVIVMCADGTQFVGIYNLPMDLTYQGQTGHLNRPNYHYQGETTQIGSTVPGNPQDGGAQVVPYYEAEKR